MSTVLVSTVDLTDAADAFRLGYPDKVSTMVAEDTNPTLTGQTAATKPPVFMPYEALAGFKTAIWRIARLGGGMGTPSGPGPTGPRLRRSIPSGTPPETTMRVASMPAGLVPTRPVWESYLSGSDPYLAG